MSAVEVRDRLGDRFRLLTGPELGPDRQATLRHAVAWSYDLLDDDERATLRARRRCSPAGSTCRPCARSPRRATTSRCCGSWTRWCASPWSSPTTAPHGPATACTRRSAPSPTSGSPRPASATRLRDRHAAYFAERGGRAVGAVERSRVARPGRLGADGAGQPAVGVPVERRSRPHRGGHRHRRARGPDGVLGRAVRDRSAGPSRCSTQATQADVRRLPRLYAAAGLRLLRRARRGRDRERPPGHRAGAPTRLRVLRARLRDVHRGARAGLLRQPAIATSS